MSRLALTKLINRSLLRIRGPDCYPYLQGLLCNDLRYLYEPDRIPKRQHALVSPNVISTHMLNFQGKIICDMLVYRTPNTRYKCEFTPPGKATEPDELLIECDSRLVSGLEKTLFGYRVRRKIDVTREDTSIWCLFPRQNFENLSRITAADGNQLVISKIMDIDKELVRDDMIVVNDPRLMSLGQRVLTKLETADEVRRRLQSIVDVEIEDVPLKDYIQNKYFLGISEGLDDHPESNCLPLESNADYLGSVSFTKGCYLGQELTSRIHHTGVIRKRLMPIILNGEDPALGAQPPASGTDILDETSGKKVGTIRHVKKNRGLGLIRCDLLTETSKLVHSSKVAVHTYRPYWWKTMR